MKVCPKCGRDYVDELSFCLEDGTPLPAEHETQRITERKTEEFDQPTVIRSGEAQTVAAYGKNTRHVRGSNRFGYILLGSFLILGMLALLGAALAGYRFYHNTRRALAELDEIDRQSNKTSSSPTPRAATPEPVVKIAPEVPLTQPANNSKTVPKVISGGVLNGKAISLPKPPYPPAARAVRASGNVTVQVTVDERGNVISATAVSGHPLLRAAAANAARGAKFSPTLLSGQPVKVTGVVTYNFVPDDAAKYD